MSYFAEVLGRVKKNSAVGGRDSLPALPLPPPPLPPPKASCLPIPCPLSGRRLSLGVGGRKVSSEEWERIRDDFAGSTCVLKLPICDVGLQVATNHQVQHPALKQRSRAHTIQTYHLPVFIMAACLCVTLLAWEPKLATRSLKSSHL